MTESPGHTLGGHVALVTGGTKGIGRAIAQTYLAAGADVVVCGRSQPDEAVAAGGRAAVFVAADVRDAGQAAALVHSAIERFGRLDIVVNNAGGAPNVDSATVSPRLVAKIIELNLLAPFYVAQAANAQMQQQDSGGLVINIGSIAGHNPAPNSAAYASAKAGLTMLTRCLGMDFAPKVRTMQVTVGLVRTELSHLYYGDSAGQDRVAATVPLGRMATPQDVADVCLMLTSPLAGYLTGSQIAVDGGGEFPARHVVLTPADAAG